MLTRSGLFINSAANISVENRWLILDAAGRQAGGSPCVRQLSYISKLRTNEVIQYVRYVLNVYNKSLIVFCVVLLHQVHQVRIFFIDLVVFFSAKTMLIRKLIH